MTGSKPGIVRFISPGTKGEGKRMRICETCLYKSYCKKVNDQERQEKELGTRYCTDYKKDDYVSLDSKKKQKKKTKTKKAKRRKERG